MKASISRRKFVGQLATLPLLALLPAALQAQIISKIPPTSPFGADSTAEEVTAGLDLAG